MDEPTIDFNGLTVTAALNKLADWLGATRHGSVVFMSRDRLKIRNYLRYRRRFERRRGAR